MISDLYSINSGYDQTTSVANLTPGISNIAHNQPSQKTEKQETASSLSTRVTLSQEALEKLGLNQKANTPETKNASENKNDLTDAEQKEIEKMKARDSEVRAHERAHMMVGGTLVRKGASYQYEMGPDGVRYAVAGEVSIDASAVQDDPSATILKMQQVKRAALAPAEPSSQDLSVAAAATQNEVQARVELRQQDIEE